MLEDDPDIESLFERAADDPKTITAEELERILDAIGEGYEAETEALFLIVQEKPAFTRRVIDRTTTVLRSGEFEERAKAGRILAAIASHHPDQVADVAPKLIDAIDEEEFSGIYNAILESLTYVAQADPEAVTLLRSELPSLLRDDLPTARRHAADIARTLASSDPENCTPLIAALLEVVGNRYESASESFDSRTMSGVPEQMVKKDTEAAQEQNRIRGRAAEALAEIARADPEAMIGETDELVELLRTEPSPLPHDELLEIVAVIAQERPAAITEAIDPLVELLRAESETAETKATAAWILALLSEVNEDRVTDAVRPVVPTVIDLLDADDTPARGAAASLLMYVADRHPDRVVAATEPLLVLLDDDAPFIRGSAAWVLGRVGDIDIRDRLADVAESDPDEEVREAASQAVELIDDRTGE